MSYINRAYFGISNTPGASGALTVSSAVGADYRTLGASQDGLAFDVVIVDGTAWEIRSGCIYTHSGTSLSRGTLEDSSTGSAISLTSAATVAVTIRADIMNRAVIGSKATMRLAASNVIITSTDDAAYEALGVLANTLYVQTFALATPVTASGMSVHVSSASSGNLRTGIYQVVSGGTASLIAEIATEINVGTTGAKTSSFASNIKLSPGYYIAAMVCSSTPTVTAAQQSPNGIFGFGALAASNPAMFRTSLTYPTNMPSTIDLTGGATNNPNGRKFLIGLVVP